MPPKQQQSTARVASALTSAIGWEIITMKTNTLVSAVAGSLLLLGTSLVGTVSAAPILCQTVELNHMLVDDSQVSACLDAGTGNLTGNPMNDLFLTGEGTDYVPAGKSDEPANNPFMIQYTQNGSEGTWSFDSSFWDTYASGAIGFKFGTGNQPDEWFVYSLGSGVSSGAWEFVNVFGRGGGLSHVNLYGKGTPTAVPEPTTLGLLGLGLVGLGLAARRRRQNDA
ncbi:MAG: PEP-CTERM sorting domain-containing protein [Ectothiorhodospiraceae bacterium]|nr:PEP-CTERM sorting domain-containing protein [Ectothiorhodospiraceae bacterium]